MPSSSKFVLGLECAGLKSLLLDFARQIQLEDQTREKMELTEEQKEKMEKNRLTAIALRAQESTDFNLEKLPNTTWLIF